MVGVLTAASHLNKNRRDDNEDNKKNQQHNGMSRVHNRLDPFLKRRKSPTIPTAD
jgi:hypothetical protein